MNEKNIYRLPVINKVNEEIVEQENAKVIAPNQSNPIYKKMLEFHHSKIGEKLSIKDILR